MLSAERKHCGMAINLFFLAKSANNHGWITQAELRLLADKAGVSKSSFYRGLTDAKSTTLFKHDKIKGQNAYRVASYATAYELFECPSVDFSKVWISFDRLLTKGFAWEARIKSEFQGKLISQDVLRKVTGVPQSTQRRWNKKNNIKRTRNIAITQYDGSLIYSMREYGQKNVFVYNGKIAKHIPSTSHSRKRGLIVVPVCKETVRTMRDNLDCVASDLGETSRYLKVFCMTLKERNQVAKRKKQAEGNFLKLNEKNKSFGVWDYEIVSQM